MQRRYLFYARGRLQGRGSSTSAGTQLSRIRACTESHPASEGRVQTVTARRRMPSVVPNGPTRGVRRTARRDSALRGGGRRFGVARAEFTALREAARVTSRTAVRFLDVPGRSWVDGSPRLAPWEVETEAGGQRV